MSEAVFSISADITPVLDDQALQQQATALSKQLNGILAKQVNKVNVAPAQGSFRPFQAEVTHATNILDKFHQVANKLPITKVAKEGSNAFLKFTDVLDVTRRDLVGYGDSLFDTIRNTHRFKDALDGIKGAGSSISDLPGRFQTLSAQIQSGTSVVDRFAKSGDRMAQLFQPVLREGEASRVEFVELNRSIDTLIGAVRTLGTASQKTGSLIADQAGQTPFNKQILEMEKLKKLVPQNSQLFKDISGSIEQAANTGTFAGVLGELTDIKKQAQQSTGVIGHFQRLLNEKSGGKLFPEATKAALDLQIAVKNGAIDTIVKLGGKSTLGPIERLGADLRSVERTAVTLAHGFEFVRTNLAKILPGSSPIGKLVSSIADGAATFKILRLDGVNALDAIKQGATDAFSKFKASTGLDEGIKVFKALDTAATQLVSTIGGGLTNAFNKTVVAAQTFFNTTSAGQRIVGALAGINSALNAVGRGVRDTAITFTKEFGKTVVSAFEPVRQMAVQTFNFVSDHALKAFTGVKGAIGDLGNVAKSVGATISGAFSGGSIGDPAIKAFIAVKGVINDLATRAKEAGVTIKDAFAGTAIGQQSIKAFNDVKGVINDLVIRAKDAGVTIKDAFAGTAIGQQSIRAFNDVKSALDSVAVRAKDAGSVVRNAFAGNAIGQQSLKAFNDVKSALDSVATRAKDAGAVVRNAFAGTAIGQQSMKAFNDVKSALDSVAARAMSVGAIVRNAFSGGGGGGGASTAGAGLAEKFAAARDRAAEFVKELSLAGSINLSVLGNNLTDGLNRATETVGRLGSAISTNLSKAVTFVSDNSLTNSIGKFFNDVQKTVTTRFTALRASGEQGGTSIIAGLGIGLNNGLGLLTRATKGIFDTVLGGIKKLFGIHSPADATQPPGRDTAAGFAKGINDGKAQVDKALAGLTSGLASVKNNVSQFAKSITTVAAVAFGGLAGAALNSGIEFNTLQQVVHGTLPVLVGSAQASDQLLASVNKLNDSSPFARSSFLQLTQTLAGFGVQAKKIPELIDAIQQTVAATGGSSADLQELGGAFARIQSQGRLSLDVLQSFSSRGVDAIGILGKEMGKTQSEIRDMISNGLVPADKAIDILTKGLKSKFDGATEAVAKNLPGALDRVHAKLRDMGAELTRAFVNPTGGGALVDFLNHISNAIKHITTDILPPLRPLLEVVAQAFAAIGAKVEAFSRSINASGIPNFVGQLSTLAPVLAGLLGFFPKLLSFIPGFGPLLANLGGPFTAFILVLGTLAARSETVRNALTPVIGAFQNLFRVVVPIVQGILPKLEELLGRVVAAIAPFIARVADQAVPFVKQLGDVLTQLITQLGPVADAVGRLLAALNPAAFFQFVGVLLQVSKAFAPIAGFLVKVIDMLAKIGPILTVVIADFVAWKIATVVFGKVQEAITLTLGAVHLLGSGIPMLSGALSALTGAAEAAGVAMETLLGPIGLIAGAIALFIMFQSKGQSAADSITKLGDASLTANGKFKALFNTSDLNKFSVSLDELIAKRDKLAAAQAKPVDQNNPSGGQGSGDAIRAAFDLRQAQEDVTKAEKDQKKAIDAAREAGSQGFVRETQEAINAKDAEGNFRIKSLALRQQLLDAIDQGVQAQAVANVKQEEGSKIIQDATDHVKALRDAHKNLQQAGIDSAKAIADNYSAASKAVDDAQTKLSGAIDSLKQGLSTIDQKLSPLFSAAQAIKTTAQAVVDANLTMTQAQTKQSDDSVAFTRLLRDQSHALQDVIKPVDELAVAERNLTRIQNSLRDSQRQLDDMAVERAKLTGQQAADDRAGLARAEERAVINLNKAKQAQLDLENQLNNAGKVSIDLTGLSLDQIRAKLATARNTAQAQGKQRKPTAQEIADQRKSASLDVADATQGVTDSKNASLQFEIDNKKKIRDIDDQSASIVADMADKQLEIGTSLTAISRLRAGENQLVAVTLDFDTKIRDAKRTTADDTRAIETASRGIQVATQASKLAGLDLQLQAATIRKDTGEIARLQQLIWNEKQTGLTWDARTQTAVDSLKSSVGQLLKDYQAITAEVQKFLKLQASAASLQGAGSSLSSFENLNNQVGSDVANNKPMNPVTLANLTKTKNDVINQIRAALGAGAAENKTSKQPELLNSSQIEGIIRDINAAYMKPGAILRDAIRDALNAHNLSMPGFAAARGLSPGMIHRGMQDGKGLVRMFEFGKEAVLPLTRPADMVRIVGDPSVLPAVLKALPMPTLPGFASGFAPGDIFNKALSSPDSSLRNILQEIFKALGLQFPGFVEGYAPGDTVSAPSMGSFSPSSFKPFSLPTSIPTSAPSSSSTGPLSAILNALPRWSRPATTTLSSPVGEATDLADIVRSAKTSGGPANADVYEKKSQREFAGTIGEAVKTAMLEAIASGDLGGGNHADIHVNPNASETQRAIAREVKRQLDKRTGKW